MAAARGYVIAKREKLCETPLRRVVRRRNALINTVTPMEQCKNLIEKKGALRIIRYYAFTDNLNNDHIRKCIR